MASQDQKKKPAEEKCEDCGSCPKDVANQDLKDSTDALIDEIDEVLEENAEEFVKAYVQRGGE
jgi:ubiquitin-like protein Pup